MSTTIRIKTTKEVLQKTYKCTDDFGRNCAIAFAISDLFPYSWTSLRNLLFFKEDYKFGIMDIRDAIASTELPEEATQFILRFDKLTGNPEERLNLEPMEFEIEVPDEIINQIGIQDVYTILENSKTLELV